MPLKLNPNFVFEGASDVWCLVAGVLKKNVGAPGGGEALNKSKLFCFCSFALASFMQTCIADAKRLFFYAPAANDQYR